MARIDGDCRTPNASAHPAGREARGQREHQRKHVVAERQPSQQQADQRIDDAQEDHVGSRRAEIFQAPGQRPAQIRQA
jgi:hypothetical protein